MRQLVERCNDAEGALPMVIIRQSWPEKSSLAAVVFVDGGTWYAWHNTRLVPERDPALMAAVARWQERRLRAGEPGWAPLYQAQLGLLRGPCP